jgi:hypothetical protein
MSTNSALAAYYNSLCIPPSLHRGLATTNLIESPQSGVRVRTQARMPLG